MIPKIKNTINQQEGTVHSFLATDNTLRAAGNISHGQLGDGTNTNRRVPVKVLEEVKSIARRNRCSFAIRSDKTLWVTGRNNEGQLGLLIFEDRTTFTEISF